MSLDNNGLRQVSCHFASNEVVDRDFEGSCYYFLQ